MDSKLDLLNPNNSWEEDRKFVLRGWSLVFSILSTLLVLSVLDGRMAYLQGPYTGYVGFWIDCSRHQCAHLHQVPVLIHMSMGFMMLALALCLILLPTMGLSFRPVFQRLNKVDLVFSTLSFCTGFLIVLSMTLFVVNCQTLKPRPHVSYLLTTYSCWGGGAMMLWAGALSYLNHVGMWGPQFISWERRVSSRRMTYCRWAQQSSRKRTIRLQSDEDPKPTVDPPSSLSLQETHAELL
ncbi:hypothetical protein HJG60_009053 [Phyllostomus discolor]|uniref:Transmembrane protein 202 n=1 Tax=Phyllostomus discolor TaxID=89673 RepID=A0A833YPP1_9CHIR|nr:hypothetical protein HJG60_009053 [Phyllostomus discolor]